MLDFLVVRFIFSYQALLFLLFIVSGSVIVYSVEVAKPFQRVTLIQLHGIFILMPMLMLIFVHVLLRSASLENVRCKAVMQRFFSAFCHQS